MIKVYIPMSVGKSTDFIKLKGIKYIDFSGKNLIMGEINGYIKSYI